MTDEMLSRMRAAQALSILETLERIQPNQEIRIRHCSDGWLAWVHGKAPHAGGDLTEALGQLTTVMLHESPPLCTRCADDGEDVPATHGDYCDDCHQSAGEAQDERWARER